MIRQANLTFPTSHDNMKHLPFFFFFTTTVALVAAWRCPAIPSTHCASLHKDVTCSGWSHKVGGWVPDPEIGAAMAALDPVLRFLSHPSMELVIKFQLRFASGQRGCRTRTGTRPALSSPGSGARSKVIARSQGDQIHHTKNVRFVRLRSVGQRQRHDELV